jgi:hypothetical protein
MAHDAQHARRHIAPVTVLNGNGRAGAAATQAGVVRMKKRSASGGQAVSRGGVWGNLPVPPDPFHWSASRTEPTALYFLQMAAMSSS